ncbi:VIT domain-containing protein [Umezawaea endophytica]|uniref:VIT domain-containing protein n=1 Tax=Umezawaea endophytica TaxID=1654476 RepID=A0A9X2VL78_9PSEU|nr:VIT domain-containing protein [Umezawaea endophytica]MCS7478556.1 VIT domain-containing protein [Umezawaea endophytica]
MTFSIAPMDVSELDRIGRVAGEGGVGALRTERGNLPLERIDVRAAVTGLVGRVVLTTDFVNPHDTALEATYVFPLPDRAAVTGMTMTADGRTVEAELQERGAARQQYDEAIAAGKRASIAEEERPDVFTMRVGNILPGERVSVALTLVGPLVFEDGAATFRFPLVVAPRYVPGTPLSGESVGDGHAQDTDQVPDASRITPPVLLAGFPNPVRLSIGVEVDPAGLELGEVRSSLHAVNQEGNLITVVPGERADRDFVLRLVYVGHGSAAVCVPDEPDGAEGTYQVTVLPPESVAPVRPRDVVLLLDRSGSMHGWKMVAARRAAARIVDTLTADDRFAVVTFDHEVGHPEDLGAGLVPATDRNRYRAVEHLAGVQARGGTELLAPIRDGLGLLGRSDDQRDRTLVLVTDGQVGNEDQILHDIAPLVGRTRVHAVGVDTAVNAGFLGRLAATGAGRCELVESEDRLDDAMEHIQRRIAAPVVTEVVLTADGVSFVDESARPTAIYPGVPLVVSGRYRGEASGSFTVRGRTRDEQAWEAVVPAVVRAEPAITAQWARSELRRLEDAYVAGNSGLESTIVSTSLKFGVLCRFTAFVAVDSEVVSDGTVHRVVQPVELPAGWESAPPVQAMSFGAPQFMVRAPANMPLAAPAPSFGAPPSAPMPVPFAGGAPAGPPPPPAAAPKRRSAPARTGNAQPESLRILPDNGLADLTAIVATEAGRLRDAEGLPAYERRDLLADLASRLDTLLARLTGPVYEPLRRLVAGLLAGGDVNALWTKARQVLDEFAQTKSTTNSSTPDESTPKRRTSFWRR